ncbi:EAL domain-containing protein [Thaumasiovibrio subtropicus]|uniref:EAL domain-containing protein n=1 Tax=Thaumasiovibrio subtropicus TaxID=1891207 RepID=UPI000B352AEC|nr:EAL domain-containing protein [Thaumasiovibrio subtropicus]
MAKKIRFSSLQIQIIQQTLVWLLITGLVVGCSAFIIETQSVLREANDIAHTRLGAVENAMALALYNFDNQQVTALFDIFEGDRLFRKLQIYDEHKMLWKETINGTQKPPSFFFKQLLPDTTITIPLHHQPPTFLNPVAPIYVGELRGEIDLYYLQQLITNTGYIIAGGMMFYGIITTLLFYQVLDTAIGKPLSTIVKQLRAMKNSQVKSINLGDARRPYDEISLLIEAHNNATSQIKDYIDTLSQKNRLLEHLSQSDPLTDLNNRRALIHHLSNREKHNQPFALIYLDIDAFGEFNNRYGLSYGDDLLCQVRDILISNLPENSFICRLSADDFVAIFEWQDKKEHLINAMSALNQNAPMGITFSIGVTMYPEDGTNANALLHSADIAMKRAKEAGNACVRTFSPHFERKMHNRISLMTALRHLIEHKDFQMHYQAKVDMETGEIIGCESLFRLSHSTHAAPHEILNEAERTELIIPLGEAIIEEVFKTWAPWKDSLPEGFRISINASPQQIATTDFLHTLQTLSRRYDFSLSFIDIEVVESAYILDRHNAGDMISRLRATEVMVSLDDFGTGFSSLEFLLKFGFDQIKIDRQFVMNLPHDEDSMTIINAIQYLSREFGVAVVAEGVENHAQEKVLLEKGFRIAQGFLYQKPLPFADFITLVSTNKPKVKITAVK